MYKLPCRPSVHFYVAENKTLAGKEDRAYDGEALGRKLAVVFSKQRLVDCSEESTRRPLACTKSSSPLQSSYRQLEALKFLLTLAGEVHRQRSS